MRPPFLPTDHRVVLINPRATYAEEIAQKCYPPLGLLYLAASLREHGFSVRVIDTNALGTADDDLLEQVHADAPVVVGIPVYSEVLAYVYHQVRLARVASPKSRIVLGGPHATAVPETTLKQFPEADFVLAGEAEHSLPLLCTRLVHHGELADIPGLYYREVDRIRSGPPPVFPDVNTVPHPARDLVAEAYDKKKYHSLLVRRRPVDTLFTSRGCPFACGFCYNFRRRYRARTPEDVVHELALIRDRGIRDVEICDDTFTVDEGRALRIFELITREKLGVSFRIKSRVDVFSERLAAEGRKAGVYLVAFGMESASQDVLDAMDKKITVEQIAQACALTRRHKMACHSSWVIGYPGETPETVEQTVRFIMKNRPTTANLAVLRPYPETAVYKQAKADGTLVGDWDPAANQVPWVRLPWAPEKAVLDEACTRAVKRIYFSPHYMAAFAGRILGGANWTLLAYALQEARKVLTPGRK